MWGATSANPLGDPTSIHTRPAAAGDRTQPGHLDRDLIIGAHNRSAILTLCERVTRYTFLVAVGDGYTAGHVAAALIALLTRIPAPLPRSLTWDQGREMRDWAQVEDATGTPTYFADPHTPWQRPTVENNNGLLRRWLPKGTSLATHTQRDLDRIADLLNKMPRRIHNGASAADLHDQIVATTTRPRDGGAVPRGRSTRDAQSRRRCPGRGEERTTRSLLPVRVPTEPSRERHPPDRARDRVTLASQGPPTPRHRRGGPFPHFVGDKSCQSGSPTRKWPPPSSSSPPTSHRPCGRPRDCPHEHRKLHRSL